MKNKIKIHKLLVRQEENCDPIEVDPCDSEGDDRVFKARIIAHYLNPECCECNCPEDNNDVEA